MNLSAAQNIYLHCGQLIDTEKGVVLTKKTVIVSGEKIKAIKNGFVVPENPKDVVVDLKSKTVMPGLIDMQVHMENEYNPARYMDQFTANEADVAFKSVNYAEITLLAGFTTVRDLGGTGVNIALRNAINNNTIVGPRIFTAGKAIATTGGHADPTNGRNKLLAILKHSKFKFCFVAHQILCPRWIKSDFDFCIFHLVKRLYFFFNFQGKCFCNRAIWCCKRH